MDSEDRMRKVGKIRFENTDEVRRGTVKIG